MENNHPMDDLRLKVMEVTGLKNVYIDPPATIKLSYPCAIITRSSGFTEFADNKTYVHNRSYQLQLIDYDPDSWYYEKIIFGMEKVRVNRHFVSNNLHYDNFIIYF